MRARLSPVIWLTFSISCWADVLVGTNGERFVGKIIEESPDKVVFESEIAGRLTVPRGRVRELQRASAAQPASTNTAPGVAAGTLALTNVAWVPPGAGKDGFDWIQLKSGEWLKGYLDYVQDKKVQFESDELEDLTLKLKDVRQLYSGKAMFTKFDGREELYGSVVLSNGIVQVVGPEQLELPRFFLQGITPGGSREIEFWSGKLTIGANVQSGNTKQATLNSSAELARRTPATQFLLNYLGNFNEVEGTESANNHRVNASYDVRLSRHWFVRPAQFEYYRDELANIAHRGTVGIGAGYYIFDRDDLEWKASAGPGYQYTRFATVEAGEAESASTPAALFQTRFKADVTKRLTFKQSFAATLASKDAGLYTHHTVTALEFEIKRYLDLDLSFVWDYLQLPQPEADGTVPQHSDLRLTLGIGAKF